MAGRLDPGETRLNKTKQKNKNKNKNKTKKCLNQAKNLYKHAGQVVYVNVKREKNKR